MSSAQVSLFRKRQFEPTVIVTAVRWYLRFSLSLRDVEELMTERGLSVDHTPRCGGGFICPGDLQAIAGAAQTQVRHVVHGRNLCSVAGRYMYPFRAVDSRGQTIDFYLSETGIAKRPSSFCKWALANPDNHPPHVLSVDGNRSYPAAIRDLKSRWADSGQLLAPLSTIREQSH